jgi:4-diphosphocytidyl-2-C-methyl-D-erythritol kinase
VSLQSLVDVPAPAKLNLFLHITGRRADGYHLLQSVFVLIDWCDTLHFERRADGRLHRHDLGAALPADDLSLRAARLLQARSGCTLGVDISIDKQVPWGAGMGGGSSDAATTLLALNRLWGLRWPRERLLALAPELGADVPFFVGGDNALVEGIGEQLAPIEVPAQRFVVVKPRAALATAEIFSHPLLTRDTKLAILRGSLADTGFGRNDLQPAAEDRCPEVALVAQWLADRFGNSRMTGSGSAVFARLDTGKNAPPLAIDLTDLPADWVGRECRSLASHPLRDWAG